MFPRRGSAGRVPTLPDPPRQPAAAPDPASGAVAACRRHLRRADRFQLCPGLPPRCKRSANPSTPTNPNLTTLTPLQRRGRRSGYGSAEVGAVFGDGGGVSVLGDEGQGMGAGQRCGVAGVAELVRACAAVAGQAGRGGRCWAGSTGWRWRIGRATGFCGRAAAGLGDVGAGGVSALCAAQFAHSWLLPTPARRSAVFWPACPDWRRGSPVQMRQPELLPTNIR